ncbi:MAG TPA: dTMP kinase [Steroidobacteraceae bacterium]|jgi:dTMP kinase|nr:dTMP kinase [Steroidobacteraceae bacterium]
MTTTAGRFLTIEGIEGVGKTTQVARISKTLTERGVAHVVTREPGGTALAEKIRDLVLKPREEALPPVAELLLMFAARAVHLANHIEPNLKAGRWVVCDRFTDATYAYQGAGRGMSQDDIRHLETMVQGARRPDLTLLLDVPVEIGLERSRTRDAGKVRDRFERERAEFFQRVRDAYLLRARAEPDRIAVIDATASMDDVTARIMEAMESKSWIS